MDEKRKRFLETLLTQINEHAIKEFMKENENQKPKIGEIVDGYIQYISDLGGGFLDFAEAYNECIKIAKYNLIVDPDTTRMKARIKDFSSSFKNTEKKMLDDVFGIEIVTATEEEKEFLILFNHLIFKIQNDKKYNKTRGYVAYHCTGDLSLDTNVNLEEKVKDIIQNTKTREYKYSKNEPRYEKNKMTDVFPHLSKKMSNPSEFNAIVQTLKDMLEIMEIADLESSKIPITEFHFLTSEVEYVSNKGNAEHAKYKKVNSRLIKQLFNSERLFMGINFPLKFKVGKDGQLLLQGTYETLCQTYPFLKPDIRLRRRQGKEEADIKNNSQFEKLLASQFKFLRKYIGVDNSKYQKEYQEQKKGVLKTIMIANRIDVSSTVEHLITQELPEIWD